MEEEQQHQQLRRGPWTVDEDLLLFNYVAEHGDGRWNALARAAGLHRTGKSCRLRWLNYLRPDVRRGNITPEEQLLILQLHSRYGNRWSKIARFLPGRTDNEIKNFWRTRVQKHARQLRCDAGSNEFRDAMQQLWMPRLLQQIQSPSSGAANSASCVHPTATAAAALPCQQPDVVGGPTTTTTNSPIMWPEAISGTSSSSSPSTSFFSGSYPATVGNCGGVGWAESESLNVMDHYAPEIEAGGWASSSRDHMFSSGSDHYMWGVEDDCAWSMQHEIDVTFSQSCQSQTYQFTC